LRTRFQRFGIFRLLRHRGGLLVAKRREFLLSRLVALLHREPEIARPHSLERHGEGGTNFAAVSHKFATAMTAFASANHRYRRSVREVQPPGTVGEHRRRPLHVV